MADFWKIDEHHIGEFVLCMITDSHGDGVAFNEKPFMGFSVLEMIGYVHGREDDVVEDDARSGCF